MHFEIEHRFPAARADVVAVLCDPTFQTALDLPDLSRPEVVESSGDGTTRLLTLRYAYVGQLDPIARKVIGGRTLTWLQSLRLDTTTFVGTLTFAAEADAKRLNGEATVTLVDAGANESTRRIAGDFHVHSRSSAGKQSGASSPVSPAGSTWKPPRSRPRSSSANAPDAGVYPLE